MFFIGIDPPKGYAIWDGTAQRFRDIGTTDFWGMIRLLGEWKIQAPTVVIEAPQMNKPVFWRTGTNRFGMQRIAQNVGMNKETSKLLIEWCELNKVSVRPVRPLCGELKRWKDDAKLFAERTGWTALTSEHGRDAAALVWGLS